MLVLGKGGTELVFSVNGFEYRIYRDVQDDCVKNYHLVFFDGVEMDVPAIRDTSPYDELTPEEFYCHIMDALYEAQSVGSEFDKEEF